MSKLQSYCGSSISAFQERNQVQSERTIALTRDAIAKLEAEGQKVSLVSLVEATRVVDGQGKGLAVKSVLRNAEARDLFHQHSLSFQQRQQQSKRLKRKHNGNAPNAKARATYQGLHTSDLVCLVEELKQRVDAMKIQMSKLQQELDAACRLRDEALNQNATQLATLTKLKERLASLDQSHDNKG